MRPGEWMLSDRPVEINVGRRTCKLKVRNTGDRPIQVGSHYHFFEANRALDFDRPQSMGMHLNMPGGQAARFEPGDEREVELVEFGGTKRVFGFNNLVDGGVTSRSTLHKAFARARERGFKGMENMDQEAGEIVEREAREDQGKRVSPPQERKQASKQHEAKKSQVPSGKKQGSSKPQQKKERRS